MNDLRIQGLFAKATEVVTAVLAFASLPAQAEWPDKPVRVMVPAHGV